MSQKRVGILRGGAGEYYMSSLKKGGDIILYILENLNHKYKPVDILIDKEDVWHLNGVPTNPADLIHKVDVIWNTTHPSTSITLNNLSIPNVSIGFFSGAVENNKEMLREHIKSIGVNMPRSIIFPKSAREVFEKFGAPWIVKIYNDVKLVKTFNKLAEAINGKDKIIVEEFISGKVASVHSVSDFRGEDIYAFPPVNVFGDISVDEKRKITNIARNLHNHIGVKHYLKSSFVLNKRGKIYLLNIDGSLNPRKDSHFSQACESVGAKMHHVVEHILTNAT